MGKRMTRQFGSFQEAIEMLQDYPESVAILEVALRGKIAEFEEHVSNNPAEYYGEEDNEKPY
jgi:hypothetical protein